jgi:hypothetical protein
MKKLFILKAIFFFIPFLVSASERFIPCSGPDCNFCHIFILLDNIVKFVLNSIVPPIAILMLIVGGLLFYFSVGDPTKTKQAVNLIKATIIGMLIIYFAWSIVVAVFNIVGVADDSWFFWNYTINCN